MMREPVIVTVDVVLFALVDGLLKVGLMRRSSDPFQGCLALPGGYVRPEEDDATVRTALRVLRDKINVSPAYLEQLKTFDGMARDPRGWSVSVVYFTLLARHDIEQATNIEWFSVREPLPALPFDHNQILQEAISRILSKSSYSSMPCFLLGNRFTLSELQATYEQLLGEVWNVSNFRRKMGITATGIAEDSFLEEIQGEKRTGRHRSAKMYRMRDVRALAYLRNTI